MPARGFAILGVFLCIAPAGCETQRESPHAAAHWSYEGETGPAHWGDLKPEYAIAKSGKRQSPIDLDVADMTEVPELAVAYKPTKLNIVNNGHAIQVNYDQGSSASFGGDRFDLLQFHFHSPSEHTVDGQHRAMEMHLVHRNAQGKLGVIGVFVEEGEENAALARIWAHLPKRAGAPKTVAGVEVNVADLLPADRTRYVYSGSLTTPPCSEDVSWIVMKTPIEASAAQIRAFQALYEGNNRPTQSLYERAVALGR